MPSAISRQRFSFSKLFLAIIVFMLALIISASGWLYWHLSASLPQLTGTLQLTGLSRPVSIERDTLGVATLSGENRLDLAQALGFIHAQERFFQMDLLRRAAAGELSELFGIVALEKDRSLRLHRFRSRAKTVIKTLPQSDQQMLAAYSTGVNQGLSELSKPSFEYLILGTHPLPWQPEDSLLTVYAMYLDLQDEYSYLDGLLGILHDELPQSMYTFLTPQYSQWDAPLIEESEESLASQPIAIPNSSVFDMRQITLPDDSKPFAINNLNNANNRRFEAAIGSNNWAISGNFTHHGKALLANDMHLGLRVPTLWYRTSLRYIDTNHVAQHITGVTLPGVPNIVVGSNSHITWSFTNAYGDWFDLVILEPGQDGEHYLTLTGPRPYQYYQEIINIKNADPVKLEIRETIWGPVFDQDHRGRWRALRWVAHDKEAINLKLLQFETVTSVQQAIEFAPTIALPALNLIVADTQGSIGWTLTGPIPRRVGNSLGSKGRLPASWVQSETGWNGWLSATEYPKLINPTSGRLWTANNRTVGGHDFAKLGDGGHPVAVRAQQIRDRLFNHVQATEADMLALQLDDSALFYQRWQQLLLSILPPAVIANQPQRQQLRQLIANWNGRASIDSAAFRLLRAFRQTVRDQFVEPINALIQAHDARYDYRYFKHLEAPLWTVIQQRPIHMINPRYDSWDEQLLTAVDTVISSALSSSDSLQDHTWGKQNTLAMRHPLSPFLPFRGLISRWLDMPAIPLPGDVYTPRVQTPDKGASQRMVVAPGQEQTGIFHMPGGQSSHPLSPFYRAGHSAWVNGEANPFLPGFTQYKLLLQPD